MSSNSTSEKILKRLLLAVSGMYVASKVVNYFSTSNHLLRSNPDNLYEWKGFKVFYRKLGTGKPILLLHDLHPASSSEEWSSIVEKLAETRTVYVLDLPGCGRSDKKRLHYTNFFFVELIKDFIHSMNLDHITVVTSNLTSAVAVMAAGYDDTLFDKIVVISPPAISKLMKTKDYVSSVEMFFLDLPVLGNFIYTIMASRGVIDYYYTEHYFYNPFHDTQQLVDISYESAHLGGGKGNYFAGSRVGKLLNIDISHVLRNLTIPIKLIEGKETKDAAQIITEWRAVNGNIDIVEIPRTKLLPHLEEPEKILKEILD